MKGKVFLLFILMTSIIMPLALLAQSGLPSEPGINTAPTPDVLISGIILMIRSIVWSISIAFVIIMFTLAGFKYLTAQGDPGKVREAHQAVIWGTAGVGVIILAWSMVEIIKKQFGV